MQSQALCSSSGSVLLTSLVSFDCRNLRRCSSYFSHKAFYSQVRRHGFWLRRRVLRVRASDDDSADISSFNEWADISRASMLSSNEGETESGEGISTQTSEVELPASDDELPQSHASTGTSYAVLNNVGIMSFSTILCLLADLYAWRIVRLPLPEYHLIRPFLISSLLVWCVGCICVPLFRNSKLHPTIKREVSDHRSHKRGTPTMGGLYLVPVGILVAETILNFSSIEVSGAAVATIAFAAIGLLDDLLTIRNNNHGLSGWMRIFLLVALGTWLSNWFYTKHISTPYLLKMGKSYIPWTFFFLFLIPNGINLANSLDGLAAGTAALAFIAMSIVVLPISCDLSVFGASMAGACIGFLFQNQYKASIFLGATGSLALGGGLAAMASCTGMFIPLSIASGIFILEAFSAVIQEALFKATEYLGGRGHRLFQIAPLHNYFEQCGIKQPVIVAAAYVVACLLSVSAAYMGLTSARIK